ncbi:unnamed protein product [Leptidea sinapis]|uniref:Uncharacterized protein n=1 Tax=Leptidea sinapis TaxID=189913 RepID=A0A5E4QGL3_9NEOP|nr:unnamed protein product [Leptidea sinapis]
MFTLRTVTIEVFIHKNMAERLWRGSGRAASEVSSCASLSTFENNSAMSAVEDSHGITAETNNSDTKLSICFKVIAVVSKITGQSVALTNLIYQDDTQNL